MAEIKPDPPKNPGESIWTGSPMAPPPKPSSLRKDLPDPIKNANPEPPVPVDTYYAMYDKLMKNAGVDEETIEKPKTSLAVTTRTEEPEAPKIFQVDQKTLELNKKEVFYMVQHGEVNSMLYDNSALDLVLAGRARFDLVPVVGNVYEIVITSTRDSQPIRSCGYASGSVKPPKH